MLTVRRRNEEVCSNGIGRSGADGWVVYTASKSDGEVLREVRDRMEIEDLMWRYAQAANLPIAFDAETAAFARIEHKGAHEHEAKEYDLPLVR